MQNNNPKAGDQTPETIGAIVNRVMARNASKWAAKSPSEQTIQRIDEIAQLAIPGFTLKMNTGRPHYPAGKPPHPDDAAMQTLREVYATGRAMDLDDPAIRATVKQRLEAHWQGMIRQREAEDKTKSRKDVRERWER